MADIDKRDRLAETPFDFRTNKAGNVFISWEGKQVKILQGKAAQKFLAKIEGLDDLAAQLIMAKETGNFKRGNERQGKSI